MVYAIYDSNGRRCGASETHEESSSLAATWLTGAKVVEEPGKAHPSGGPIPRPLTERDQAVLDRIRKATIENNRTKYLLTLKEQVE